jgi:hypothetical protein
VHRDLCAGGLIAAKVIPLTGVAGDVGGDRAIDAAGPERKVGVTRRDSKMNRSRALPRKR